MKTYGLEMAVISTRDGSKCGKETYTTRLSFTQHFIAGHKGDVQRDKALLAKILCHQLRGHGGCCKGRNESKYGAHYTEFDGGQKVETILVSGREDVFEA
jgi:hypothetical protein